MIDEIKLIEELNDYMLQVYGCEIDEVYEYQSKNENDKCSYIVEGLIEAFGIINNQPKVNEWISVENRLPEEHDTIFAKLKGTNEYNDAMFEKMSDDVNVTVEFKDGSRKTMTMHTTDRKWMTGFELTKKKVIAWMPLPSKYEGQGE